MKYNILFLALTIAATCAAQKSEHVRNYLGARYETEAPTGDVVFRFEKAALRRTGDGQKTWRALLTHTATYSDGDDAGALLGIRVNGQTVPPEGRKAESATAAVPILPKADGGGMWSGVPDSSRLEQYKTQMLADKARFGRELAPRQDFLFWTYRNFALPILFFVALIFWLIAKAAYKESLHDPAGFVIFGQRIVDIGHLARYFVFGIAGVVMLIEIANDAVSTFFVSDSLWWWMGRTVVKGAVAYFIFTRWIVPNPRVSDNGGMVRPVGGGNFNNRLNG